MLLFVEPIRCRKCLNRFFRFSESWARIAVPCGLLALTVLVATFGYMRYTRPRFHVSPETTEAPKAVSATHRPAGKR